MDKVIKLKQTQMVYQLGRDNKDLFLLTKQWLSLFYDDFFDFQYHIGSILLIFTRNVNNIINKLVILYILFDDMLKIYDW